MREPDPGLEDVALRYARGEREGDDLDAFEGRLAADQAARDALCRAVESEGSPHPGPAYRDRVRSRLRPGGLWGRFARRRTYRGHPALWAVAGAAVAAVLFVAWPGPTPPAPAPDVARNAPAPTAPDRVPAEATPTEAGVYIELTNFDHLASTVAEVKGRRDRWPTKRPSADLRAPKAGMKQG